MCEKEKRGPDAARVLEEFKAEKEALFHLLEEMRVSASDAEAALVAIKTEAEAIDKKEEFFRETVKDLEEERRLRRAAEKALADERTKNTELLAQNEALLSDKQALLKLMVERR